MFNILKGTVRKKINSITILILIFVYIFISILYFFERNRILKTTNSELQNTNLAIVNMIKTSTKTSVRSYLKAVADGNITLINSIYEDYNHGKYTKKEAMDTISKIILNEKIGKTGYTYVVNSQGVILIHPKSKLISEDVSQYDFVRKQITNKKGYLEYEWKNPNDLILRKKALYMEYFKEWDLIISVSAYINEFEGLINIDDFRNEVLAAKYEEKGYAYVITDKGVVIIHPNYKKGENWYEATDNKGNQFIKRICEQKNGTISYFWKNPKDKFEKEKLVVFKYIPELKWIVVSGSYKDEYLKPMQSIQLVIIISSLIFLMLYILQSYMFTKLVIQPILKLVKDVRQVIKREELQIIRVNTKDEIGELSEAIILLNESIKYYENHLEKIVEIRTNELNIAYEELEKKESILKELTIKDALTGLYNRRGITEFSEFLFQHSIRNKNFVAILMIDLDNFKLYNDTYGHPKGDLCLSSVGDAIHTSCSRPMDMAGRYGGEEFIVILAETDKTGAVEVAERIEKNIRALAIEHKGNPTEQIVTVSIGIYTNIPQTIDDIEKYIKKADKKLYVAKANGKGRVEI